MTLRDLINQLQDLPEEYLNEDLFTTNSNHSVVIRVNKVTIRKMETFKAEAGGTGNSVHPPRLVITLD